MIKTVLNHSFSEFGVTCERGALVNGAELFLFRRAGMPLACNIIFFAGSRFDIIPGTAHFLEHMLLSGTEKYPAKNKLAEPMASVGGSYNAATNFNGLWFYFFLPHRSDLPVVMETLDQMLFHSRFDDTTIELERTSIQDELRRKMTNPEGRLSEISRPLFYQKSIYERSVIGDEKTIATITKKDLISYRDQYIKSDRMAIVASGDITFADLSSALNRVCSIMPSQSPSDTQLVTLPIVRERTTVAELFNDNRQTHLQIGFRTVPLFHSDRLALIVLASILGASRISRLITALRYQKGLVYGVNTYSDNGPDGGLFSIVTSCQSAKVQEIVDIIFHEIDEIRKGRVSAEEVNLIRSSMVKSRYGAMQTSESWISRINEFIFNRSAPRTVIDDMNGIEKITLEQVITVAKKYLGPNNVFIAVLGTSIAPIVKE